MKSMFNKKNIGNDMNINKKIKVIEIVYNGKVQYLAGTSIFDSNPLVDNPLEAIDYEDDTVLNYDMGNLYITNVGGAMSGVRADSAQVVEFEVEIKLTELSRK